jgi:hypothetical protein
VLTSISSGVFDTPKGKCPPDRGSSDWVTDSPAPVSLIYSPVSSTRSLSSIDSDHFKNDTIMYPPTPPLEPSAGVDAVFNYGPSSELDLGGAVSAPQDIPNSKSFAHEIITPPQSPEDGPLSDSSLMESEDALDLLATLFPKDGVKALPHARKVSISSPNLGSSFEGVVLALPDEPKTFYVDGKSAASVNLRERCEGCLWE